MTTRTTAEQTAEVMTATRLWSSMADDSATTGGQMLPLPSVLTDKIWLLSPFPPEAKGTIWHNDSIIIKKNML
ncbi:UNVERIFIED_CONTAM: hypothetical protein NCL1_35657 [Trichonephila clavipes]